MIWKIFAGLVLFGIIDQAFHLTAFGRPHTILVPYRAHQPAKGKKQSDAWKWDPKTRHWPTPKDGKVPQEEIIDPLGDMPRDAR